MVAWVYLINAQRVRRNFYGRCRYYRQIKAMLVSRLKGAYGAFVLHESKLVLNIGKNQNNKVLKFFLVADFILFYYIR